MSRSRWFVHGRGISRRNDMRTRPGGSARWGVVGWGSAVALVALITSGGSASASGVPGDAAFFDTAVDFSVIAASTVTNTGPSTLNASLALSPGTAITGFPPGTVAGTQHAADGVALTAQNDVTTAVGALLAVPAIDIGSADLDGLSFVAGSYSSASSLLNNGTITLVGDADDVFIFTAVSTITTGAGSTIVFTGDVQECNVFWRAGSSATLGAGSHMVGTVVAQASVGALTGASIAGRLFAQTAAVTLQSNVFTGPTCTTAGGDGGRWGSPEAEAPTGTPPDLTPGGPTGPVLPVPEAPIDVVPQLAPIGSGSGIAFGLAGVVALGGGLVMLASRVAHRRRGNFLRGENSI